MDNTNSSGQNDTQPMQKQHMPSSTSLPTQDFAAAQQTSVQPASPTQGGPVVQDQSVVPAQPQQQPVQPSSQPVAPVSGGYKEGAPLTTHEIMQPSEAAPEVAPEVKEAGVEVVHEVPQLTLQDQKSGIQHAKETVPHPTGPTGSVKLPPMTEEEAVQTVKTHKKVRDAVYWIALALVRQFSKKHEQQN